MVNIYLQVVTAAWRRAWGLWVSGAARRPGMRTLAAGAAPRRRRPPRPPARPLYLQHRRRESRGEIMVVMTELNRRSSWPSYNCTSWSTLIRRLQTFVNKLMTTVHDKLRLQISIKTSTYLFNVSRSKTQLITNIENWNYQLALSKLCVTLCLLLLLYDWLLFKRYCCSFFLPIIWEHALTVLINYAVCEDL